MNSQSIYIILLVLIGILSIVTIYTIIHSGIDAVEAVIISIVSYVLIYILNSGMLFWINRFSILKACSAVTLEMVIIAVILVALCAYKKQRLKITFNIKRSIVPIVIALVGIPFVMTKFGFFGMGQDQGVYQIKALALINGVNDNVYEISEINDLSDEDQELYKNGIGGQYGFYKVNIENTNSQGVFHGINTYPALLALWGSVFGYQNMNGGSTILYACAIFLVYYLARRLGISRTGRAAAALLYAVSPMIMWLNKSTLAENVTILIMLMFLYFITSKKSAWLAGLTIAAYAFYHVMIYVMMPMFVVVCIYMYLATRKKGYITANIIGVIAYKLGYMMMLHTAGEYTIGNYDFIERLGVSTEQMPLLTTVVVAVVAALSLLLILLPYPKRLMSLVRNKKVFRVIGNWLIRLFMAGCLFMAVYQIRKSIYPYANMTLYALVMATSIIFVPIVILILALKTNVIYKSPKIGGLILVFLYCGLLYPAVLSPFVGYYNYYSRYITVYIAVTLLAGLVLLENVFSDYRKLTIAYAVVAIGAVALYARYDLFILKNVDETRIETESIEKIEARVQDTDAVIMSGEIQNQLYFTTRIIDGSKMYPIIKDLGYTVQLAKAGSDKVYYISDMALTEEQQQMYAMTLADTINSSSRYYNKELREGQVIPYQLEAKRDYYDIYVYLVQP